MASRLENSCNNGLGNSLSDRVHAAVGLTSEEVSSSVQTERSIYLGRLVSDSYSSLLAVFPFVPHLLQTCILLQSSSSWLHLPSFHLLHGSSFFQFFPFFAFRPLSSLEDPATTETPIESICAILRSANLSNAH